MGRVLLIGPSDVLFNDLRGHPGLREHDVQSCASFVDALSRLRFQSWEVLLTDPATTIGESLAVAREVSLFHPSVRIIALWPAATSQQIIEAMRADVFACFTEPFDSAEIANMVRAALRAPQWRDAIEVVSGLPHWLTLRVACHLITAERLTRFMSELQENTVPNDERDLLIAAFRELLLNAMEHGAGFDRDKVIQVTAAKTARAIVYHFKDPGGGFDADDLTHAARSSEPDDVVATALDRAARGLRPGGFGMLIARQVADELVFNEARNEVLLSSTCHDHCRRSPIMSLPSSRDQGRSMTKPDGPSTHALPSLRALPFLKTSADLDTIALTSRQREQLAQISTRVRLPARKVIYREQTGADWYSPSRRYRQVVSRVQRQAHCLRVSFSEGSLRAGRKRPLRQYHAGDRACDPPSLLGESADAPPQTRRRAAVSVSRESHPRAARVTAAGAAHEPTRCRRPSGHVPDADGGARGPLGTA